MRELTDSIKAEALRLGFDLVGVAEVRPSEHEAFYREWLEQGRHGSMSYLSRPDAVERRLRPDERLRSAVIVALNYYQPESAPIARYARGRDYHKVIKSRLLKLLHAVESLAGASLPLARAYVDTGPVFERELARRAGLGWFGRNTMLINPRRGSFFFLGALLLELDLEADAPFVEDHCGTCSNCVQACPTGALLGRDERGAPIMDARRCISYLTIENRGAIPLELRPLVGDKVFGCDICQDVCPWNGGKFVQITREPDFLAVRNITKHALIDLMQLDEPSWDKLTQGSPIRRARRSGFLRNVAVALGNNGDETALPVLQAAVAREDALVREHAKWAIEQIRGRSRQ